MCTFRSTDSGFRKRSLPKQSEHTLQITAAINKMLTSRCACVMAMLRSDNYTSTINRWLIICGRVRRAELDVDLTARLQHRESFAAFTIEIEKDAAFGIGFVQRVAK